MHFKKKKEKDRSDILSDIFPRNLNVKLFLLCLSLPWQPRNARCSGDWRLSSRLRVFRRCILTYPYIIFFNSTLVPLDPWNLRFVPPSFKQDRYSFFVTLFTAILWFSLFLARKWQPLLNSGGKGRHLRSFWALLYKWNKWTTWLFHRVSHDP